MIVYDFDYLYPSLTSCLLYIQCLVNSFKNITSVKNYISGAKTFVAGAGGDPAAFTAPLVATIIRGAARLSTHVPAPALPISKTMLIRLCLALRQLGPDGRIALAAVLFGVTTFLRQCNFLPTTPRGGGPHLIRRGDIRLERGAILVRVRSTKTRLPHQGPITLMIAPAKNSSLCPVAACSWAWRAAPAPPGAPLFLLSSSGSPLTSASLVLLVRSVLRALGHHNPGGVSLHSLRRTGAQLAADCGIPDAEVMAHGTWTSGAFRAYVSRPASSSVPAALATVWDNPS